MRLLSPYFLGWPQFWGYAKALHYTNNSYLLSISDSFLANFYITVIEEPIKIQNCAFGTEGHNSHVWCCATSKTPHSTKVRCNIIIRVHRNAVTKYYLKFNRKFLHKQEMIPRKLVIFELLAPTFERPPNPECWC